MTTQYQLLITFVQLVHKGLFTLDGKQRLELLLCKLKVLLLRVQERYGEESISRLCPLEELEELRILLLEGKTSTGALMVQGWLEEGLRRIIARFEGSGHSADAGTGEVDTSFSGSALKNVNKNISHPGE